MNFSIESHQGKNETFEQFFIKINNRFEFTINAEIYDSNSAELDIDLISIEGQNGDFEPKAKHYKKILDLLKEFVADMEDEFRDSQQDWCEYYSDLHSEY